MSMLDILNVGSGIGSGLYNLGMGLDARREEQERYEAMLKEIERLKADTIASTESLNTREGGFIDQKQDALSKINSAQDKLLANTKGAEKKINTIASDRVSGMDDMANSMADKSGTAWSGNTADAISRADSTADEVASGWSDATSDAVSRADDFASNVSDTWNQYAGESASDALKTNESITSKYSDREDKIMDYLKGSGEQERADIEQRFKNRESDQLQGLTNRGLGNTTIMGSMQAGNNRLKDAELGRLDQRLRDEYVGTSTELSGDTLSANKDLSVLADSVKRDTGSQALSTSDNAQALANEVSRTSTAAELGATTEAKNNADDRAYDASTAETQAADDAQNRVLGTNLSTTADQLDMASNWAGSRLNTESAAAANKAIGLDNYISEAERLRKEATGYDVSLTGAQLGVMGSRDGPIIPADPFASMQNVLEPYVQASLAPSSSSGGSGAGYAAAGADLGVGIANLFKPTA